MYTLTEDFRLCVLILKKSMQTTHLLTFATIFTQRSPYQDFPGGPVVKTPHFHCRGSGLHPGPETSILHAVQPKSFKKEEASASVTIHLTTPKQKLRNYPCLFPLAAINFSKFCGFSFKPTLKTICFTLFLIIATPSQVSITHPFEMGSAS